MKDQIIILSVLVISVRIHHCRSVETLVDIKKQTEDGYYFKYTTNDGQERQETGKFEKLGDNLISRLTGSYSYMFTDGRLFKVWYEANERGYKPRIQLIPVSKTIQHGAQVKKAEMVNNSPSNILETTTTEGVAEVEEFTFFPPPAPISSSAIASLAGGGLG
ncbi:uncharacterized protein isoform X2 [Leptinotarsa decemlineata]|uniref:uncharacterized protein isoform X2 n=1 Tax=Leptinotarsa decemlineata TaxID=7539 RepID=UPI003D306932